jgi:hypothetical protein
MVYEGYKMHSHHCPRGVQEGIRDIGGTEMSYQREGLACAARAGGTVAR